MNVILHHTELQTLRIAPEGFIFFDEFIGKSEIIDSEKAGQNHF